MTEAGRNSFDPKKVQNYVARWENVQEEIESEKGKFMQRCKTLKDDQRSILDEAKDKDGIPKAAMRGNIERRKLERKIEAIREDMEPDDRDRYDLVRHALGDLPDEELREATLAREAKKAEEKAALEQIGRGPPQTVVTPVVTPVAPGTPLDQQPLPTSDSPRTSLL